MRSRWTWWRVAVLAVAATPLVALALSSIVHSARSVVEARAHPAPGTMADLGTHAMHYVVRGEAGPAVLFDAGLPGTHHDWSAIQEALAPYARTVAFDRAGYGWSTRGPQPRTASTLAGELRHLLDVAGIDGPYILVGHSFGGITMRAFARHHPHDVAALVLVDATHEDHRDAFPPSYAAQERRTAVQLRLGALLAPLGVPRLLGIGLLPPGHDTGSVRYRNAGFATAYAEFAGMAESLSDVRDVTLGDLPLTVVTRGRAHPPITGMTPSDMVALDEAWRALQQGLLRLSTDAELIVADDAGHFVHRDRPDLLIDIVLSAIQRLETDQATR